MRTAHQLARILASKTDSGINLTLETDTGQVFCVAATDEQVGALAEEVRGLRTPNSLRLAAPQAPLRRSRRSTQP
jgi:hypothetical protein